MKWKKNSLQKHFLFCAGFAAWCSSTQGCCKNQHDCTFSLTVFLLHPLSFSLVPVFLQFLGKSECKEKINRHDQGLASADQVLDFSSYVLFRICLQISSSFKLSGNPQARRAENKTSLHLPDYRKAPENVTEEEFFSALR